jgi:hypothetical protein
VRDITTFDSTLLHRTPVDGRKQMSGGRPVRDITTFDSTLLHRTPVDGRKQINGLATIVESEMGKSPCGPALFGFAAS